MAEIGPVAAKRLARLRRDFLSMPPEEAEAFVAALRHKRSHPVALKRVKTSKGKDNAEEISETSHEQDTQDTQGPERPSDQSGGQFDS